jgi:uncharacterized protein (TIGR02231 family)
MMTKLDTHLIAVVVYPDRARLTRQGQLALQAGSHQVEIADLPLRMDPASARASARGTARARLMGLQVQRAFFAQTPAEQVRVLEEQLEAAQDKMSGLDAQVALLEQQRAHLDALAGHTELYATALAAGEMSFDQQSALFESLRKSAATLDTEHLELVGQKRALERQIQQIKRQLDQLRSAQPRERYVAQIDLEVTQPGDLSIELTYVVSGAGWTPLYDLRLVEGQREGSQEPSMEFGYLAQVTQTSGEDWVIPEGGRTVQEGAAQEQNGDLTLSTARPALAATLPELDPWYVGPRPPPVAKMMTAAAPLRMAAPAAMEDRAPAPMAMGAGLAEMPVMQAEEALASVERSGAAVTYRVAGKVSIPSDGTPQKVTVARYSLPPKLDYVAAPRLVEAAYRRAKVTNDSPYTLLPGPANLFAGDEFIGATRMELTAPQEEIELYLGVDDRLKVERELKRREVDKSMLGGKRRIHYSYEIRLENLLDAERTITVHDQIPVSRHEDLKVRLEAADPKPTKQTDLNLLDWELSLVPRQKYTIHFDFVIEFPQTMEVIGLP